jgi:hypothetical protein
VLETWGSEESILSPVIAFDPATMSFTGTVGGSNPAAQTLNIWNSGGGTLNWTVSDDAAWLESIPDSGSSTGDISPVTVSVALGALTSGTYNASININAIGAVNTPQSIPVTFEIAASPPTIINDSGATDITSSSARLNGNLISNGGADTTVHVCWGDDDAGTGTWDNDENLGVLSTGAFYFDASGLSNGTTYYYRCYATNSAGNSWADSSSSFLAQDITRLIGVDELATSSGNNHSDVVSLCQFTASAYGSINQVRLKCSGEGNVKVAVYADDTGEPGTLLQSTSSVAVFSGWNIISLPSSVSVDSGTDYWLGTACDSSGVIYYHLGEGTQRTKAISFSSYSFPDPAGTGYSSDDNYILIAGGGSKIVPLPPAGISPGTAITFKWNASERAETYWLQINTASDFSGTDMFNADVGNTTAQRITGFTFGETYYWRVKAGNAAGWSDWSQTMSVTGSNVP